MNRYFVSYEPYQKAAICIESHSDGYIQDFLVNLLNKEFWTEATWLEYWLYRIFE